MDDLTLEPWAVTMRGDLTWSVEHPIYGNSDGLKTRKDAEQWMRQAKIDYLNKKTFGACSVCEKPGEKTGKRELRPYGEGGEMICAGCGLDDPKRNAATLKRMGEHIDRAVMAGSGAVVIGAGHAPLPHLIKPPPAKA